MAMEFLPLLKFRRCGEHSPPRSLALAAPPARGGAVILSTLPLADTDNMIPMRTS
jgi:hypothetical protein